MTVAFIDTRSRSTDGDTSHVAARNAATHKAAAERRSICCALSQRPMTAREVAQVAGIGYIECQRRISECGLVKTGERRDGCAVWAVA